MSLSSSNDTLSSAIQSLQQAYGAFAYSLQQLSERCKGAVVSCAPTRDRDRAVALFSALSKRVTQSAETFCDGLDNLQGMAEVVSGMLSAVSGSAYGDDGNATWTLTLNLLTLVMQQLHQQEADVVSQMKSVVDDLSSLKKQASIAIKLTEPPTRASKVPAKKPQSPDDSENSSDGSKSSDDDSAHPSTTSTPVKPPPPPPKKATKVVKGKKSAAVLATKGPEAAALITAPIEAESDSVPVVKKKKVVVVKKKKPVTGQPELTQNRESPISVPVRGEADKGLQPRSPWEPECLQVVTRVADAMGPLVVAARPNVFSDLEVFFADSNPPVQEFFVDLDDSPHRSLAALFVRCWLNIEHSIQEDFACDVLNVDRIVQTSCEFCHVGGPIGSIPDESNVQLLPPCGWRELSNVYHTKRLHTFYAFVDRTRAVDGTGAGGASSSLVVERHLVIHDVVVGERQRDEVVTRITPILALENRYATVSVFGNSSALGSRSGGGSNKLATSIGSMLKDVLEHCGFDCVAADVVKQALADRRDQILKRKGSVDMSEVSPAADDEPQVASEESRAGEHQKGKRGLGGLVMGIGKSIALAPLTASKAVTSLVTKTAESVMMSQTDAKFREWFPSLAAENVVNTYNCAVMEGAVLKQGFLFITPHWLAFHAPVLTCHFQLEFDEVRDIRKEKTMKMFDNAIDVEMFGGEKYFFTSFLSRDEAFATVYNTWRSSGLM